MTDDVRRMAGQIDEIHRHLLDPNQGVAVRLARVETQQAWLKRTLVALASLAGLGGVATKLLS
jgi:hypothetical protein